MYHKIAEIKNKLVEALEAEIVSKGVDCVDTDEAGKVADMIKDLAKAEKECLEASYYEAVIEAMEEDGDENILERRGYNRNRSESTGRYTSGRGSRGSRGRSQSGSRMRMGYNDKYDLMHPDEYWEDRTPMERVSELEDPRYGKAYNKFRMAKRHYHETRSQRDKDEMSESAKEHVSDTIMSFKEMWKEADPELRKDMKTHFEALMKEMNI